MPNKTRAFKDKAAFVAKFVVQHREYCAKFQPYKGNMVNEELECFSIEEYTKLVQTHLMTMVTRILKVRDND